MNYYDVLGVHKQASEEEIKKAYKKLAMKHHPDRGGDAEQFKKINEAYAVLTNPEKKMMYDQYGTVDTSNIPMPNMEDLFENLFGFSFGGHHNMFGQKPKEQKTPDTEMTIEVGLEDVMKGSSVHVRIRRKKYSSDNQTTCSTCRGQGQVVHQTNLGIGIISQNISMCHQCRGTGKSFSEKDVVTEEEVIPVPIPKGIPQGNRLVVRGKGDIYPKQFPGDVIMSVVYKKHDIFEIDPNNPLNLVHTIRCTLAEYLIGLERHIQLLDDRVLHVYSKTALSKTIDAPLVRVIKNYGFTFRGRTGDLVIRFNIILPTKTKSSEKDDEINLTFNHQLHSFYLPTVPPSSSRKSHVSINLATL